MIDATPDEINIIKKILHEHVPNREVRVFGSRILGTSKPYSDIDLVLMCDEKIDLNIIFKLKDAFEFSTLPYRVDVVDWQRISQDFQAIINQQYEII